MDDLERKLYFWYGASRFLFIFDAWVDQWAKCDRGIGDPSGLSPVQAEIRRACRKLRGRDA